MAKAVYMKIETAWISILVVLVKRFLLMPQCCLCSFASLYIGVRFKAPTPTYFIKRAARRNKLNGA